MGGGASRRAEKAAGAALYNANSHGIEIRYLALKKASEELGTGMLTGPVGEKRSARLFVNGAGKRFMNEEEYLVHNKDLYKWLTFPGNAETGYLGWTNQPVYLIFDSQLFGSEAVGGFWADYGWAYSKGIYTWSADNQAELDKGWLVRGDTLEELAANLAAQSGQAPLDAAALAATVQEYNAAAASGQDALGRTAMLPLDKGPFYAAELSMSVMYTIGGLKVQPGGRNAGLGLRPHPRPVPRGRRGPSVRDRPPGRVRLLCHGHAGRAGHVRRRGPHHPRRGRHGGGDPDRAGRGGQQRRNRRHFRGDAHRGGLCCRRGGRAAQGAVILSGRRAGRRVLHPFRPVQHRFRAAGAGTAVRRRAKAPGAASLGGPGGGAVHHRLGRAGVARPAGRVGRGRLHGERL